MIDLSFLSEEEQETILAVLNRDAELKKAEEQRVQNLQKSVMDKSQLKYLTGEWFYEAKQLRHHDRIHGSDIIRASMRHTHKPLTILELSHILPEKSSFVSSECKEVFIPPVLRGFLQELHMQPDSESCQNQKIYETPEDPAKPVLQSPIKQRKNPFNNELNASHTVEENNSEILDRAVVQTQTPNKELLPPSDSYSYVTYANNLTQDNNDSSVNLHPPVSLLVSGNTAVSSSSQDCFIDLDRSAGPGSAVPLGILKHLPTSSSIDSLFSDLDLQSPSSLDSPTETWIDRKQVRFSSTLGQTKVKWQDGMELEEHSLLDTDSTAPSEMENNQVNTGSATTADADRSILNPSQTDSQKSDPKNEAQVQEQDDGQHQAFGDVSEHCHSELINPAVSSLVSAEVSGKHDHLETKCEEERHSQVKATDVPSGHNIHEEKLPERSTKNSFQATSDTKPSASGRSSLPHAGPTQARQTLLRIFGREKDRSAKVQRPQKEDLNIPKLTETGKTQTLYQSAAGAPVDMSASVEHKAKLSELTDVKTLQLTALQNTTFTTTVDADTEQEATEGRVVQLPQRLSNLKAFWEKENTGPKIIFTKDARQEDIAKAGTEASHVPQTYVERKHDHSLCMEMAVQDIVVKSLEKSLSLQTEGSLSADLSKQDGTYRANPVVIYEGTEDSLTVSVKESQISNQHESFITPLPCPIGFNTQMQVEYMPVSFSIKSRSIPQEDRQAKISELKHFWEKEYTGPRVIVARVKEASHSLMLGNKEVSPQSDQSTSKSEGEEHTSSYRTKPSGILKPLKVTDKGFVSLRLDRSQLKSSSSTGDVPSSWSKPQVKAETDSEERPLSPSQSYTTASKDPNDKVRRSPSKTCHPRALPKESSSPKRSSLEGSPLKTFPIDIDPQTKAVREQQDKLTPVPRQRQSPLHEANQTVLTDTKPSPNITSCPLPLHPQDTGTYFDIVNTQHISSSSSTLSQSKKTSEKKFRTFTHLTRSFIPQDYQYYLGPKEKPRSPPFHHESASAAETDAVHRAQSALREFVGNQSYSHTGYDGSSSPITSTLKPLSARTMSSSKSLENLTSQTISSHLPSASALSNSKQTKNLSVPVLQQNETESDSSCDTNLGWRRNTGSSMSNISLSSGMASMSSQISGSNSNIYPADCGDIEVLGSVQFAVNYIQKLGEFHIFVVHCRDLAVADTKKNRSDPYVKCYLLPDKLKLGKRKTAVKKKTLNPTYNEILRFNIKMEELKNLNLNISVWHNDTFGRNNFLGEVDLDLSEWDFSNTQINEYALKTRVLTQTSTPPSCLMDSRGQMRVALRFLPQMSHSTIMSRMETGEVQIWVKDCKNLPSVRGVMIDPFVKCTVLPDTSRKSRQKTRVVKRTANPMFNHTMVYDGFRPEDLREACVELTVWDHDRLSNHYIGGLRLGLGTGKSYGVQVVWMDSTTDEAHLWQRMLQSDGEWVEDVLPLRILAIAKSMSK